MLIRKTSMKKRDTYTYYFNDGTKIVLRPGEDGVTEEHIKMLHAMDDAEVYGNIKNNKTPVNEDGSQLEWTLSLDAMTSESEIAIGHEEFSSEIDSESEKEMVDRILWFLTDKQREVYYLVAVVGLTQKEVAKEIGASVSTINEHWLKALERIEAEKPNIANNYS